MNRRVPVIVLAALAVACVDDTRPSFNPTDPGSTVKPEAPVEPQFSKPADPALLVLRSPARLVLTPSGRLLVSDYYRGTVLLVDPGSLQPEAGFSVDGEALAVGLWGGRIFVGNATTKTVEAYGANGRWRYSFGGGPGAVEDPTDLAIDRDLGLVFVVDGRKKQVKVFDVYGTLKQTIAGFDNPTGIAVDEGRHEVLVSDFGDLLGFRATARIRILDYYGKVLQEISGQGSGGMGQFSRPQGLAVDERGRIYLVDALRGEVLIFDRTTGQQVGTLGSYGPGPGQLTLPLDLVIGKKGEVFVTSYETARIEQFAAGVVP